jgi:pantoate--beta-alanine ligase
MEIIKTRAALTECVDHWKNGGQRVAFVPTMGALHDGHLSLVKLARQHGDKVVVSIFVNPTQFAPHEDFDTYPRQEDADARLLMQAGVDALYLPARTEMYPNEEDCTIKAGAAAAGLETDFRPHFFDGVVNVVSRLFGHVRPDAAIFGEKDFQQLQVISEMVNTQKMPIKIIGAPIARDEFGLALSSRNAYLNDQELQIARKLNVILREENAPEAALLEAGFDKVDYVAERWGRRLGAVWIGKTRLIDNIKTA